MVGLVIQGNGFRCGPREGDAPLPPQIVRFGAIVTGIPTPHLVLPQPQINVDAGASPTRQCITRDEHGEIVAIDTVPQ